MPINDAAVQILGQIAREQHRLLSETVGLSAEQAELAYQAFRLAAQTVTGVHFDDFHRKGRPADEDRILTTLMIASLPPGTLTEPASSEG